MAGQQVIVEGLDELIHSFARISAEIDEEIVWGLQETADPVRKKSTQEILSGLRNMSATPVYAAMRVGVSRAEKTVYVVPAWRARGGPRARPNLKGEFQKRMDAALESQHTQVEAKVETLIDQITRSNGF